MVLHNECSDRNRDFIKNNDIKPIFLEGSTLAKMYSLYFFLRRNRIEMVFSFLFAANLIAAVVGKLTSVPFIIGGFRGSMGYGKIKNRMLKFFHNHFNYLTICNSHSGYEYLKNLKFEESKLRVIHNGIDVSAQDSVSVAKNEINILSVGRFDHLKDYKTAIEAIGLLKNMCDKSINFRYTIIGYGSKEIKNNILQWAKGLALKI